MLGLGVAFGLGLGRGFAVVLCSYPVWCRNSWEPIEILMRWWSCPMWQMWVKVRITWVLGCRTDNS